MAYALKIRHANPKHKFQSIKMNNREDIQMFETD